jgi:pepF/M3 family oligoendopeptidase
MNNLPRWDLTPVYPSFDSDEYKNDCALLTERIAALQELLEGGFDKGVTGGALLALLGAWDAACDYAENLASYAEAVYTADTRNERALAEINAIEELKLPLGKAAVVFRNLLAAHRDAVLTLARSNKNIGAYRFFLSESIEKAAYQMTPDMEDLANDLSRSGADAWARLHEALSSTASSPWDGAERKTVTALRALANDGDRNVRQKAYQAELEAWKAVEIPMAAALNGVKGHSITVDRRRGWKTPLEKSAFQSRLGEKTLYSLISAIESSLPLFRRYLKVKSRLLGLPRCAFFDLFAPVGGASRAWSWGEAERFVVERFGEFDPAMADFARRAYSAKWVDAGVRDGKIGGAYCTDFPLAGESRILCNFDGSFDSVLTLAHETGHAWHHEVIKDEPRTLSVYPMTLAETASIFAETLVFEGALKVSDTGDTGKEKLALIEGSVKDSCQVLVDILSRFYFEKELFARRAKKELSAAELCEMMLDAQKKTYGDGLDPDKLHPYMWAVKIHYYSPALAFYNYPYAFGQLFALSLYARAKSEGAAFAKVYRELLFNTGRRTVEDLAAQAGFNIEDESFWQQGINVIAGRIDELERLANEH